MEPGRSYENQYFINQLELNNIKKIKKNLF